jgi:hypothetical protein
MLYAPGPNTDCGSQRCMEKLDNTVWTSPATISSQDKDGVNRIYLKFSVADTNLGSTTSYRNMAISSWPGNTHHLDLLAIRQSDDHVLRSSFSSSAGWTSFTDLGGGSSEVTGGIASVSWGANRIDWVTVGTDQALRHGWWSNGSFGWEPFGGGPAVSATIASQGPGLLDVFAVRTDGKIYQRTWNNSVGAWTGWTQVTVNTGGYTGPIKAVSWGVGRIDMAAAATGNQLRHLWWNSGGGWFAETMANVVSPSLQSVTAATWGPGRLDIIYPSSATGVTAKRVSYEGGWGQSMDVVNSPIIPLVGDATAVVDTSTSGTQTTIDYVYVTNVVGVGNVWRRSKAIR